MRKQDDRCSSKEVSCLPYFRILFSESPICPYLKLQQLFAVIHLSPPCNMRTVRRIRIYWLVRLGYTETVICEYISTGGVSNAARYRGENTFLQMTILILESRCNVYVLQQLFRVPKIVTFLLLVIAPSSSSPYILYAFALLQGTHAGFHVRMGAFCHVQKLLTACCRSPPCFPPLCSHKISSMYGVRIPLNKSYGGGEDEPCRAK